MENVETKRADEAIPATVKPARKDKPLNWVLPKKGELPNPLTPEQKRYLEILEVVKAMNLPPMDLDAKEKRRRDRERQERVKI